MSNHEELTPFDASDYLDDPETIAHYLTMAAQDGEACFLAAVGDVAKAYGMSKLANESGLERSGLYKAFAQSSTATQWRTVQKVLDTMGYSIEFKAKTG